MNYMVMALRNAYSRHGSAAVVSTQTVWNNARQRKARCANGIRRRHKNVRQRTLSVTKS